MNFLDEKFKELLARSQEYDGLVKRLAKLEEQLAANQAETDSLKEVISSLTKGYIDLAKAVMSHRQALDEVFSFLTDPAAQIGDGKTASEDDEQSQMTPDESEAYKKSLN